MKTTVELPDDLFIEAKKHAAEHRTTIKALIESGLRNELGRNAQENKPKRVSIKWVTTPGGSPKGVNVADRAQMLDRLLRKRY